MSTEERARESAAIALHQRMGTKLRTHPWAALSEAQRNIWRDRARPVCDAYKAAIESGRRADG